MNMFIDRSTLVLLVFFFCQKLARTDEVQLEFFDRTFTHQIKQLNKSNKCLHIDNNRSNSTIILYDLLAVNEYLKKIKYKEGDVIDAFNEEYRDSHQNNYWNREPVSSRSITSSIFDCIDRISSRHRHSLIFIRIADDSL
jgi:hypothetical protein